jgi:outer membrane protein
LKQNIKHSLKKKRKTTRCRDQRFKQDAKFSKSSASKRSGWAQQKGAELQKKRATLSAQQALSQQLQQESGTEMDTLVSEFIKAYGKEKDILISTVRVMRHLSYMLKINMTLQKIL